jgi:hypothetical protein
MKHTRIAAISEIMVELSINLHVMLMPKRIMQCIRALQN